MPTVWQGAVYLSAPCPGKVREGQSHSQCVLAGCTQAFPCLQRELHYWGVCAASTGAEHQLLASKEGEEGCSLCSCTQGFSLHSSIVLHRAFLPCSLTCSVTNYSLITGWQKKSFTALRLFLTNQVTEALKIILSRKAPWGFFGCLGCVKLY